MIGGGNMARGIIGGLLGKGARASSITVSEPVEASRHALVRDFGVRVTADNAEAVRGAQVVVLAVKPQLMAGVAKTLAPALRAAKPLVISVAAGIRADRLQHWLGTDIAVVRAMPNRPALIGAGASGLYADASVPESSRRLAEQVLASTGLTVWVGSEEHIDAVTALSGSGPAYFFRLAELMAEAGVALGLDAEVARRLAAQTLAGAGQLVAAEKSPDLARMRAEVTSKGGTTEAALNTFAERGFDQLVAAAMAAAERRSRELAAQSGD
ncbi:MAG TPA: pyrroline-5-carboxylate reductase [Steroidobacteraceae bacterium]|nr:pyrroline-5-carboxylate reductase [Steroidobacteraceae bacterium]